MTRNIIVILFSLCLFAGAIYLEFFAPCSQLGWSPTKDLPARCLGQYAGTR